MLTPSRLLTLSGTVARARGRQTTFDHPKSDLFISSVLVGIKYHVHTEPKIELLRSRLGCAITEIRGACIGEILRN